MNSSDPTAIEVTQAKFVARLRDQLKITGASFVPVEGSTERRLELPEKGVPLAQLAGLGKLVGLEELTDNVPEALLRFEGLSLMRLEIDPTVRQATVEVRWAEGRFPLIPGVLELSQPGLSLALIGFPEVESAWVDVIGRMSLGGAEMAVAVELPGLGVSAQLTKPYPLAPLLEHFGMDGAAFGKMRIDALLLSASPQDKLISLNLGMGEVWDPGGGFKLDQVEISMTSFLGEHRVTTGRLATSGTLAEIDVELAGEHAGPDLGWQLSASAAEESPIKVGELLVKLLPKSAEGETSGKEPDVPGPLKSLQLENLEFTYDTRSKSLTFHGEAELDVTKDTRLHLVTGASLTHQPDGTRETKFTGSLTVAGLEFDVLFNKEKDKDAASSVMLALYKNVGGQEMHLKSLIAAVSDAAADALGDADPKFKLNDVLLVYEPGDKKATPEKLSKYLFALDMDFGLNLSGLGDLPLIGSLLPTDQALRLAFQPIITSKNKDGWVEGTPSRVLTKEDLTAIKGLLPEGSPELAGRVSPGFSLISTLRVGDLTRVIQLGAGEQDDKGKKGEQAAKQAKQLAPADASELDESLGSTKTAGSAKEALDESPDPNASLTQSPDKIQWIELQKHFGPLHIDRVGLGLAPGKIAARLDAALAVGPMTISLEGLGADYDLDSKHLSFALDGIGLDFQQETLSFSGAFLRLGDAFLGKATLRMETLSLGALGAYGEVEGHPSFFIYAFLDYPLGGPAFFFVEGLALGFGYNRRLIVPEISELHRFPLIAEVTGHRVPPKQLTGDDPEPADGIRAEMMALQHYLPAELDQYFLAIGVKFNSFKVLDGFALLVISFGKHLEFDIIGQATLELPPPPDGKNSAPQLLARVNSVFSARYVPDEGFLGVRAHIGPGSFVYTPDCHLQGDFAFYSWFKGEHEGDFVYTMGGYHPHFRVPAHYPQQAQLDRLGFQWNVDSHLTVKGGLYYALTPAAAMAGGHLEASWHSGALEAWFNLGLDLLIQWQPYHYEAQAHVEIGARVTINPPIIGTIRITIEAGAELEIWGPEFSGRAHVHVSVMGVSVGFSVEFIETSEDEPPGISWDEFAKAFLPEEKPEEKKVCTISVTGGLLRTLKEKSPGSKKRRDRHVVNPKEFALETGALIPSSKIQLGSETPTRKDQLGSETPETTPRFIDDPRTGPFGVAPMHLSSATATHAITVTCDGEPGKENDFIYSPVVKRFPAALWGAKHKPAEMLNAGSIQAIGGYEIKPSKPAKPGTSSRIERRNLDYEVTPRDLPAEAVAGIAYSLNTTALPENAKTQVEMRNALKKAVADPTSTSRRAQVLAALGMDAAADVDLSDDLAQTFVVPAQLVSSKVAG